MLDHAIFSPSRPVIAARTRKLSGEAFSTMINLSGRRRFTSQRVVLYAVLASQSHDRAVRTALDALALFRDAHDALVNGSADLPGVFCDELNDAYFGPSQDDKRIRGFIVLAEEALAAINTGARNAPALLARLIDSETELLGVLNRITGIYESLAKQHALKMTRQLQGVMADIESIARQARSVSLNAQVVAARAGHAGREFAVVSTVLSGITAEIDELIREALRTSRA